ncbi:hypothetical protein PhCBS80983_g00175 [Powellomyces hirtus]|uniref:RRM domain-containing protein n=1 Tax=Powellomyces hirtus TaxID=109895 RepID=A0A507EHZ1_9FUNG|nr:hypothetical protein PhCBS80983_g00175 [Powellomyces hirtus]
MNRSMDSYVGNSFSDERVEGGALRMQYSQRANESQTSSKYPEAFLSAVLELVSQQLFLRTGKLNRSSDLESLAGRQRRLGSQGWSPIMKKYNANEFDFVSSPCEAIDQDKEQALMKASTNSLVVLLHLRPNVTPTGSFAVLKLSNIAWNLSLADVASYFAPFTIPIGHVAPHYTQGVHIVMNRATGKTHSDCFVEFPTYTDAQRALDLHSRGILKGRIVVTQWSTQAELVDVLFPHRAGHFKETKIMEHDSCPEDAYGEGGLMSGQPLATSSKEGVFLLREEINALLLVCRNYKLHFSRKCAERPFENIISIISKVPWHEPHLISTSHRDHLFEMLKLALESLRVHLDRYDHNIDETLMERMSFHQQMPCFPDLARFVYNPPQVERSHSPDGEKLEATSTRSDQSYSQRLRLGAGSSADQGQVASPPEEREVVEKAKPAGTDERVLTQTVSRMSLYPSPPDADAPMQQMTPTPMGPSTHHLIASESYDSPATSTPAMTLSLYAARIRMLEQALRQSEARYEDLRKRHESALARFQEEQQEVISGKLRTERRCVELELDWRDLEKSNTELKLRCASLEDLLLQGSATPDQSNFGVNQARGYTASAFNTYNHGTPPREDRLDTESVRSIWN